MLGANLVRMVTSGKLVLLVAVPFIVGGCDDPGQYTEDERQQLVELVDVEDVVDYCEILQILYEDPTADQVVVGKIELLLYKNLFPFKVAEVETNELGLEEIIAIEAFLRLAEHDAFPMEARPELILPVAEYLRSLEPEFADRREWLKANTVIIL